MLLAVGSEMTVGETRDTNSGDLARSLSGAGVDVLWISALPDRLASVVAALRGGLTAGDVVVTTGGLGPTPDDLTREAIAEAIGERPTVDRKLESWLRHLFERRGAAFAEANLKQAWLIPSATSIPNERGTAPGWWVDLADGRVAIALPGPPREMSAMWRDWVLPRLQARGLGQERVTRTYRLTGIGESAVAALLGDGLLRAENPVVATYARSDAVDVRISAVAQAGRGPAELVEEAATAVLAAVGDHVWGRDDDTWSTVLGRQLHERGWTAALVEVDTGGSATRLLGGASWLLDARTLTVDDPTQTITALAERARHEAGASIGIAVRAVETGEDTRVDLAVAGPWGVSEVSQTAFLGGSEGRRRAALAAASFLFGIARAH